MNRIEADCEDSSALRVVDKLWCRFAEGDFVAHFLDSRSKSFDLLLLLCDRRLEFGDCALLFCNFGLLFRDPPMFFQELVEQHRGRGLRAKI